MKRRIPLAIVALLAAVGCEPKSEPPTHPEESAASTAESMEVAPAPCPVQEGGLDGTVWIGESDHQNCEGCLSTVTWRFIRGGKLRQERYPNVVTMGTWELHGDEVSVTLEPWGLIDLERKGGKMTGVTRFRGGYGFGFEYKLEQQR